MKSTLYILGLLFILSACHQDRVADTIFVNAHIYTVDSLLPRATAMAITGDTFSAVGTDDEILKLKGSKTVIIDAEGQFIMPGFIEGHGHFSGLGKLLLEVNLFEAANWQEVEKMVGKAITESDKKWITGRGWHQDKWNELPLMQSEGYPHAATMDGFSEDRPVMLLHASGHALFANNAAMEIAGVTTETPDPNGGRIIRDESGQPIGVFEETAMDLIKTRYNDWYQSLSDQDRLNLEINEIRTAEQECLKKGVTSFQDAGSDFHHLELFQELSEKDSLDVRLWVMFRDSLGALKKDIDQLPYIKEDNKFYTCRAIKSEIDGALGSYGAWLLRPYDDKPGFSGQNTTDVTTVEKIADLALQYDMQLCVHAIGDKGNRVILEMMEEKLKEKGENHRWRIEHAQHLHPNDIPKFSELGIIASMQSVHCTSDAPFVVKRLGQERAREGAYVWKSLLQHGAVVSNGTDAPVEDVSPIENLYAAVTRQRRDNGMVFFKEQSISREEALYSMTMACAYAGFEEDIKGSISRGKLADFILCDRDLVKCSESEILDTDILATYVGGELKYAKAN